MTESCDSSEHFIQKVPIGFCPSPPCSSRRKKIMQLCSCLDHSSEEDESSSAKTWFPSTTGHPRIQPEPFFTFWSGTSDHTPSVKFTTPAPETWLQLGGPWTMWQSNSWSQGTLGFRSVITEVPQCPPISCLMSFRDLKVTTETGDTLLKNTPLSIILRQNRSSTWCAGTCNLLTVIL